MKYICALLLTPPSFKARAWDLGMITVNWKNNIQVENISSEKILCKKNFVVTGGLNF